MKKLIVESLNTTVSISPPAKMHIKTPVGTSRKIAAPKLTTMPSASYDKITRKAPHSQQTQLLQLQVEQLRRENRFLKKKIDELSSRYENCPVSVRNITEREKHKVFKKMQGAPLSVKLFFEEVSCLMVEIDNLFKIDLSKSDNYWLDQPQQISFDKLSTFDLDILKPINLQKSLERVMLEDQSQKLSKMLNLFSQFYGARKQMDRIMIEHVDSMVFKVNELSKTLLSKYEEKMRRQEEVFEYYHPDKEINKNLPFSRKHNRNKSGQFESAPLDPNPKFFRRNKPQFN